MRVRAARAALAVCRGGGAYSEEGDPEVEHEVAHAARVAVEAGEEVDDERAEDGHDGEEGQARDGVGGGVRGDAVVAVEALAHKDGHVVDEGGEAADGHEGEEGDGEEDEAPPRACLAP